MIEWVGRSVRQSVNPGPAHSAARQSNHKSSPVQAYTGSGYKECVCVCLCVSVCFSFVVARAALGAMFSDVRSLAFRWSFSQGHRFLVFQQRQRCQTCNHLGDVVLQ